MIFKKDFKKKDDNKILKINEVYIKSIYNKKKFFK